VQTLSHQPKILVVEDEAATQHVVTEFLQDSGFAVLSASSGTQACAVLAGDPEIEAVFTDLRLPDINGYQFALWVRRDYPRLPIVLGSGGGLAQEPMGTDFPFFLKPYDLNKVAICLHAILADR
jgi:CheY-like chemotaxis protein